MSKRRYDFCETQFGGTAAEFDCCTEEMLIKEMLKFAKKDCNKFFKNFGKKFTEEIKKDA